ncbi:MAG: hypothetical protein R3E44_13140 [Paracoccaceae bacterium]
MIGIWLAVVCLGMLARFAVERAGIPGYDFRYFWLAGELWGQGLSPYGDVFGVEGARLITSGHIPEIWPYPPNLWLPSIGLGLFDLTTAWHIWLCIQVAAVPAASAALAFCLPLDKLPGACGRSVRVTRFGFFCLHTAFMAAIEATQLSIHSGPISIMIYLGLVLVICGIAGGRRGMVSAGLVVLFMKPQIGAAFALALVLSGRDGMRAVFSAALISLLLIVPPVLLKADVLLDWLHSVGGYDGVANKANLAASMTGIRNLVWTCFSWDMGNLAAMGPALAVSAGLAFHFRRAATRFGKSDRGPVLDLIIVQSLVVLALAPLHNYDFTLIGVSVLILTGVAGFRRLAAVAAIVLILHPNTLFIWIQGGTGGVVFPGSMLATIGALLLLVVALTRDVGARKASDARMMV